MPTLRSVDLRHRGGMHFTASPSSGHPIDFDESVSNQGGSPVETVLAALGSCSAMDVISIATKKRQAIQGYEIHVSGSQRDEYPQVFTEIDVTHEVTGTSLSEAAIRRAIQLSATKYCPVQRDALGGRDRRPPPLPDPLDRTGAVRGRGRGRRHGPVCSTGHPAGPALAGRGASPGGCDPQRVTSWLHDYAVVMYSHPTMTTVLPVSATHSSQPPVRSAWRL